MSKILLVLALFVMGHAQELTPTQASKLKNYNHSLSGKMRYKKLLQKTAIIDKDKAYSIASEECKSEVYFSKLSVRSMRLFYTLYSHGGRVKIDALDGKIIQRCTQ